MYYPKLTYASSTIEGVFLFGILCLSNKIYGLESLYYIGNFQIMHMEETNKSKWETPFWTFKTSIKLKDPKISHKYLGSFHGYFNATSLRVQTSLCYFWLLKVHVGSLEFWSDIKIVPIYRHTHYTLGFNKTFEMVTK